MRLSAIIDAYQIYREDKPKLENKGESIQVKCARGRCVERLERLVFPSFLGFFSMYNITIQYNGLKVVELVGVSGFTN